ncbi:MAG: S16 family serine protease [Kofleriaceae bacterium]
MAWAAALAASPWIACGGPPRPPTGATRPDQVKQYKPMESKGDAKARAQAVILGTDGTGGSTVIPLVDGEGAAVVDSMWVRLGGGPATGGTSPVKLLTEPNDDGTVKVGVYEQYAGGIGQQWRAGVWVSAFVASSTLGKDLTDYRFTAEAGGNVDGASASGLMAAGFLAAMTGTPVDPLANMTGTINPDGTIGPVGGIPQKFLGSIAAGKKRLGFPIGMQMAEDANTGQPVDLVALAASKGATAVEVADVYAAYELLTGKRLPHPVPVAVADMAISPAVEAGLDAAYDTWRERLATEWASLLELDEHGRLPDTLRQLALEAQRHGELGELRRSQGQRVTAYHHVAAAWVLAASATSTSNVLEAVQRGDHMGAQAQLHEFETLMGTAQTTLERIGEGKPATMGGHLRMLSAFERAWQGWGFHVFATDQTSAARRLLRSLEDAPPDVLASAELTDQVVTTVAPAVLAMGRGVAYSILALEALDLEQDDQVSYRCSLPNVRRMAASFQSAAGANVNYFESLFVQPMAQQIGMSDQAARDRYSAIEPDYLVAYMNANLPFMSGIPSELKTAWGEDSLAWGLATLAGSELAYFKASLLIGKHYSLGVENDQTTGLPVSVEHARAFDNMLATAERTARENARAARIATGAIPIQARLAYQNATALTDGDLGDRLRALEALWRSSSYSQIAVMLARN